MLPTKFAYMPYFTLWDLTSQNLASLEGDSHNNSDLKEISNHFTTDFMKK